MSEEGLRLALPEGRRVVRSELRDREEAEADETQRLEQALAELGDKDIIVIDTPGSDNFLSRLGHSYADTLVTPLNDSFLDLDLLAAIDPQGHKILSPSIYSQMVWEQRQRRAMQGRRAFDWIVMRNRLAHVDARNKRDVGRLLEALAKRIGFRLAAGLRRAGDLPGAFSQGPDPSGSPPGGVARAPPDESRCGEARGESLARSCWNPSKNTRSSGIRESLTLEL